MKEILAYKTGISTAEEETVRVSYNTMRLITDHITRWEDRGGKPISNPGELAFLQRSRVGIQQTASDIDTANKK